MSIPYLINYILYAIWLIIPLRQVKTNYFLYFFVYAASSALMLLDYILLIHPAYFYLGIGFFLIISLFNFTKIPYYIFFLAGVLIISIILPFLLSITLITFCLILLHTMIFIIILMRTVINISEQEKLNIFHFVLLLYELTTVTRFVVVLSEVKTGLIFFYLTAAFGIFIGIFFLIYNEVTSPKINLGTKEVSERN
jgi:hypothetical protein